jgi:uncharacterized protein YndB with AHSA1/START domain
MAASTKNEAIDNTTLELTSDTDLVITRTFRAPAAIVFDAWTKPEYVKRWWAPKSRGVTLVECEADIRPGGTYRYVLGRDAVRFTFSGEYLEITRPTRIVYTQRFEPHPGAVIVTVSFEELAGSTKLVSHERYPSKEVRDSAFQSGMEDGMRETLEQLAALVISLRG